MKWKTPALRLVVFVLVATAPALAAEQDFTDPIELLHAVAKTYASGTETFHMESISEFTTGNELNRTWQKTYLSAIKDSGNRYHIQARSGFGSWVLDSDGKNEWLYLVETKKFVKHPLPEKGPQFPATGAYDLRNAWGMRAWLEADAGRYKHATLLPADRIWVEGKMYWCYVVHVTSDDSTEIGDKNAPYEMTFWIDKAALVFRKKTEHRNNPKQPNDPTFIPSQFDVTTVFPVTDFHPKITTDVFAFSPPADAEEVATLERAMPPQPPPHASQQWVGKTVPAVIFSTPDGKSIDIASYRGRPLLLDLWATWCGPCLLSMPALNHIHSDYKSRGLAVVTVDEDHTAENATTYLSRHQYGWTNYHDPDGKTGRAFGDKVIPLTVLIDAKGRIIYYDEGGDEAALRKAIAGLGPEFVAPAQTARVAP